jgi:hypothetical protein
MESREVKERALSEDVIGQLKFGAASKVKNEMSVQSISNITCQVWKQASCILPITIATINGGGHSDVATKRESPAFLAEKNNIRQRSRRNFKSTYHRFYNLASRKGIAISIVAGVAKLVQLNRPPIRFKFVADMLPHIETVKE